MVISRTPFRVSFFGGGTDYPAWFRQHGGCVLTSAINRYCYISARYLPPFFETRSRIVWSRIETVNAVSEIQHPAVRAGLQFLGVSEGVEIHHDGDLPARSGLGSSSAFTVGLLHALYALKGTMVSKARLANEAIHIEQTLLAETVGIQDQIQVAYGGINLVEIRSDGAYAVCPVTIPLSRIKELQDRLMLFFTGISRFASDVARSQVDAIPKKNKELMEMAALVKPALDVLVGSGSLDDFGRMLHEGWLLKRSLSGAVTNERVNEIYQAAIAAGARGGKLLGAGGGGFMLIYASPEYHHAIRDALADLLEIPFKFEYSGSQIIFCDNGSREATFVPSQVV